jgi:hypothetical protein
MEEHETLEAVLLPPEESPNVVAVAIDDQERNRDGHGEEHGRNLPKPGE